MAILNLAGRPVVRFDVTSAEHRELFYKFLKNGTWKDSPYQFYLEDGGIDLIWQLHQWVAGYYLGNEFEPVKAPRRAKKGTMGTYLKPKKK
jgi:hypothetical protein